MTTAVNAAARTAAVTLGAIILTLLAPAPATADPGTEPDAHRGAGPGTGPGTGPGADPDGVVALLDATVPGLLGEHGVPGAAVVVVDSERQLAAAGYGLADVDRGTPVDAERTRFRLASVTKLLTATAALQLVERGELSLDGDVDELLGEPVVGDAHPGRPVTLAHLLTHTAGFEEDVVGTGAARPEDVLPLASYVTERQPARVRPPGELASYSNYGTSLVGHLVAEVSGMRFEDYLATGVLDPLGMHATDLAPPRPGDVAVGYGPDGESPAPVEHPHDVPAGAATATAVDVGRFLRAHLRGGELDGRRVLAPETAALMHAQQATHDPRLPGMAYGFIEQRRAGHRLLSHGGDIGGYHGLATLAPGSDLGVYVVTNGDGHGGTGGAALAIDLTDRILDELLPPGSGQPATGQPATRLPATGPPAHADRGAPVDPAALERYAGAYRSTRVNHTNVTSIGALLTDLTVRVSPDGTLRTTTAAPLDPRQGDRVWLPAGRDLFRERDGHGLLAFAVDSDGRATAAFDGSNPTQAFERLAWHERSGPQLALLLPALAVLAASALAWPVTWFVRPLVSQVVARRRGGGDRSPSLSSRAHRVGAEAGERGPAWPSRVGWVLCLTVLLAVAALAVALSDVFALVTALATGTGTGLLLLRAVGLLLLAAVPLTLAAAVAAALAWPLRWWAAATRVHLAAVVLAAGGVLSLASGYHLLDVPA